MKHNGDREVTAFGYVEFLRYPGYGRMDRQTDRMIAISDRLGLHNGVHKYKEIIIKTNIHTYVHMSTRMFPTYLSITGTWTRGNKTTWEEDVAIKLLKDPLLIDKAEAEVLRMSRLDHPNIVKCFGISFPSKSLVLSTFEDPTFHSCRVEWYS